MDVVLAWVERELRAGRMRVGEPLPPERVLCGTLNVGRSAVREAKARLQGRGVVLAGARRLRVAGRTSVDLFDEWVTSGRLSEGARLHQCLEQALELRRLLLPELLVQALRRGSAQDIDEMLHALDGFSICLTTRARPEKVMELHDEWLCRAAMLARNPILLAVAVGLAECIRESPLADFWLEDRRRWGEALDWLRGELRARRLKGLRAGLRRRLAALDAETVRALKRTLETRAA